MISRFIRWVGASALALASLLAPMQAGAVTINFEGASLTGLYFVGDSFTQSGYNVTASYDFGIVDTAATMNPAVRPIGNSSQFYFATNDGGLWIESESQTGFQLLGFSAAFVPQSPPSAQQTVIVAFATYMDNSQYGVAWLFAPATGGNYNWGLYNNPLDFAPFVNMRYLDFFACSYDGVNICAQPTNNNGQFVIDNIHVVPEPSALALSMIALFGLALTRRRTTLR